MKKIVMAGLLVSGLMAADDGMYVGVDIGNTAVEEKVTFNGVSQGTFKDDGGSQTLKVGYHFDKNHRITAFYQHINVDGGAANAYGAEFDYLFGDNPFKPFAGVVVGRGSLEFDGTPVDIAGGIYGVQAGLNYAFNENISAEAGYRYMKSNMEGSVSFTSGTAKIEIDPIGNWHIGLNYKF